MCSCFIFALNNFQLDYTNSKGSDDRISQNTAEYDVSLGDFASNATSVRSGETFLPSKGETTLSPRLSFVYFPYHTLVCLLTHMENRDRAVRLTIEKLRKCKQDFFQNPATVLQAVVCLLYCLPSLCHLEAVG